jgi:hypothetical protein
VLSGVVTEEKELASVWFWPILTVAFVVFGAAKLVRGFIGLFYRSPK